MPGDKISLIDRLIENGVLGYIGVLVISIWAGTVRYIATIAHGEKPRLIDWAGQTTTSAFVGVITNSLCTYYEIDASLQSAIIGVAAYHGTKTLAILMEIGKRHVIRATAAIDEDNKK